MFSYATWILIFLVIIIVIYFLRRLWSSNEGFKSPNGDDLTYAHYATGSPYFGHKAPELPPCVVKPSLGAWDSYISHFYYDPWWAYSYPFNRLCDAMARRDCGNTWHPRDCYRQQYNKCVTTQYLTPPKPTKYPPISKHHQKYLATCPQKSYKLYQPAHSTRPLQ